MQCFTVVLYAFTRKVIFKEPLKSYTLELIKEEEVETENT